MGTSRPELLRKIIAQVKSREMLETPKILSTN